MCVGLQKMLSPEIWNFPVPSFSLSKKICHFDGDVFDTVKKQLFNHHVRTLNIFIEITVIKLHFSLLFFITDFHYIA